MASLRGCSVSARRWVRRARPRITSIEYITLTGADASRRIEVKNYSAHAAVLFYAPSSAARASGNEFRWFNVHHNSTYGVDIAWQDNGLFADGVARANPPEIGAYEFVPAPSKRRKDFNADGKDDILLRMHASLLAE